VNALRTKHSCLLQSPDRFGFPTSRTGSEASQEEKIWDPVPDAPSEGTQLVPRGVWLGYYKLAWNDILTVTDGELAVWSVCGNLINGGAISHGCR
jgi:hypothetical protein